MKKTNLLFTISFTLIISILSCKKDDDTNSGPQGNQELANQQNATEETDIELTALESGIEIPLGTKSQGTPPAPNSNIDFQLNTSLTEGIQGSGINIEYSSTADVAGAYIQFTDTDGNPTGEYFDVPVVPTFPTNKTNQTSKKTRKFSRLGQKSILEDFDNIIDVNFGEDIPAGKFCYEICIYDSANNISQIQTVCVTVEAWGGNAEIVGEWIFDREEPGFIEEEQTYDCDNGSTFTALYSQILKDEWTFVLAEDGSYYEEYDQEEKELNFEASFQSCSAIYSDEVIRINDKFIGNWAYNEENETLTVIDFEYEDFLNPSSNDVYPNGIIYFQDTTVEVISGQLVISERDDDGILYKIYFNRK